MFDEITKVRHSGRAEGASPESMNTEGAISARPVFMGSGLAGFARDPE
jgi:hypothetical protein